MYFIESSNVHEITKAVDAPMQLYHSTFTFHISVLTVISRLFGKLVASQLYQHMNDNGYFNQSSQAFCAFILLNIDFWYNGLDLGKLVGLVFIDLKRYLTQLIMTYSVKNKSIMVCRSGS